MKKLNLRDYCVKKITAEPIELVKLLKEHGNKKVWEAEHIYSATLVYKQWISSKNEVSFIIASKTTTQDYNIVRKAGLNNDRFILDRSKNVKDNLTKYFYILLQQNNLNVSFNGEYCSLKSKDNPSQDLFQALKEISKLLKTKDRLKRSWDGTEFQTTTKTSLIPLSMTTLFKTPTIEEILNNSKVNPYSLTVEANNNLSRAISASFNHYSKEYLRDNFTKVLKLCREIIEIKNSLNEDTKTESFGVFGNIVTGGNIEPIKVEDELFKYIIEKFYNEESIPQLMTTRLLEYIERAKASSTRWLEQEIRHFSYNPEAKRIKGISPHNRSKKANELRDEIFKRENCRFRDDTPEYIKELLYQAIDKDDQYLWQRSNLFVLANDPNYKNKVKEIIEHNIKTQPQMWFALEKFNSIIPITPSVALISTKNCIKRFNFLLNEIDNGTIHTIFGSKDLKEEFKEFSRSHIVKDLNDIINNINQHYKTFLGYTENVLEPIIPVHTDKDLPNDSITVHFELSCALEEVGLPMFLPKNSPTLSKVSSWENPILNILIKLTYEEGHKYSNQAYEAIYKIFKLDKIKPISLSIAEFN